MDSNIHYLLDRDGYVKHPYIVKCIPLPMLTMSKPEKTDSRTTGGEFHGIFSSPEKRNLLLLATSVIILILTIITNYN